MSECFRPHNLAITQVQAMRLLEDRYSALVDNDSDELVGRKSTNGAEEMDTY